MRGDVMYLLLVICAFSVFFVVILWLQVSDARHRRNQLVAGKQADPVRRRKVDAKTS